MTNNLVMSIQFSIKRDLRIGGTGTVVREMQHYTLILVNLTNI